MRLSHINLTCPPDLEIVVLSFYRDTLELVPLAKDTGRRTSGGWFRIGDAELHVSVDPVSVDEQRANPRHVALIVDDLDLIEAKLSAAGAEMLDDPRPPANGRRLFVVDPAGNRLELIEPTTR